METDDFASDVSEKLIAYNNRQPTGSDTTCGRCGDGVRVDEDADWDDGDWCHHCKGALLDDLALMVPPILTQLAAAIRERDAHRKAWEALPSWITEYVNQHLSSPTAPATDQARGCPQCGTYCECRPFATTTDKAPETGEVKE
jgi:hypothetical protein